MGEYYRLMQEYWGVSIWERVCRFNNVEVDCVFESVEGYRWKTLSGKMFLDFYSDKDGECDYRLHKGMFDKIDEVEALFIEKFKSTEGFK